MNIILIDTNKKVNATFVPLALLRLSTKHKIKGDKVELIQAGKKPKIKPDIIYFSFIFLFNWKIDVEWVLAYQKIFPTAKIIIGGISPSLVPEKFEKYLKGVELFKGRDEELEALKPDFDIAGIKYSYGFTSRGCPNKCEFCVVPKLEGRQRIVEDWKQTIDPKKKAFYGLDNNFLACGSKHVEEVLSYCDTHKIKIDMNQGMDAEILHKNPKIQKVFQKFPKVWKNIRFAWDTERVDKSIVVAMDFVADNMPHLSSQQKNLYMLYDAEDSPETVYKRIKTVYNHRAKFQIKLMRYKELSTGKLARKWGGVGQMFADIIRFVRIGLINHTDFFDYVLQADLKFFLETAEFVFEYAENHRNKKTSTPELIAFIEQGRKAKKTGKKDKFPEILKKSSKKKGRKQSRNKADSGVERDK